MWPTTPFPRKQASFLWPADCAAIGDGDRDAPSSQPLISIDAPAQLSTVGQPFYVTGWAIDLASSSGAGMDAVHVYAYPNADFSQPAIFLGTASCGGSRGDVGAAFGAQFTNSGYFLSVPPALATGLCRLVVFGHSLLSGQFNAARMVDVHVLAPLGPQMAIDAPVAGSHRSGAFVMAGWAIGRAASSGTGVDAVNI